MSVINKITTRAAWLKEFYFFQRWGMPVIKQDKISKSILKKYLPNNPVIVDCGAHDGIDSMELAKILGGQVHAFEPVDNLFTRLKKRTKDVSNIHCYNLALSNESGTAFFYISEGSSDASSSLLEPSEHLLDHPDTSFNSKTEVQTLTLDEWARQNEIAKVDMLWLDMQGFEVNMLMASDHILQTVSVIHTEVSTKETYKGVIQYSAYRSFLESKGFSVVEEAIPAGWDMGNVLFVRK
jgi:FkbM family methyltransferase